MRTITENGKIFVLVPIADFERITEDYQDILAYDQAKARGEENFPIVLFDEIDAGERAIKIFRKFRKLKQTELAKQAGISAAYLNQIESGKKNPTVATLSSIAGALNVPMDMLV